MPVDRDPGRLTQGPFDLLVVGGGVYGAWTAYDAALRGLRVALVEQHDWASATSSASSKLIHGGLRYLEQFQFGLVRTTLDERRRLARLAPHAVRPQRFLFPVYRGDRVGRFRLGAGLWFYDRLAGRNQPVAPHRRLSRGELLKLTDIDPEGLRGGFAFGDCGMDDARLVLEIVDGAWRAGVAAVNRVVARELLIENDRVTGARLEDLESGATLDLRAAVTACCAGPWVGRLTAAVAAEVPTRLAKGVHLVLPALPTDDALVISSNDDGRIVFVIPWYGRTLLGTTDTDYTGDPVEVRIEQSDVDYLLERAARTLHAGWTRADVITGFCGVRTLSATKDLHPSAVTREWHLEEPREGLLVPVGGKYTSARADAAAIVDRVCALLGRAPEASPTAERPFPWAPEAPLEDWLAGRLRTAKRLGLDDETARSAARRYGVRLDALIARIRAEPDLARRIHPETPFCRAEIVLAARDEMARSLDDVLRRRVPLLLLARLDRPLLEDAGALVGRELGWSEERRLHEIAQVAALARGALPVTDRSEQERQ